NQGFVGWTGGYASAPSTTFPNSTGGMAVLTNGAPMNGGANPGSQGNAGFVQLYDVPWIANAGTSVNGYSLKFEVYVASGWSAGAIGVLNGGWYGWPGQMARYAPWTTATGGNFQPKGWVTATIPINQFITATGGGQTDDNQWDLKTFPTGGTHPAKF